MNRSAILRAITCDPKDCLAWMALADNLEEEGELRRAELARLSLLLRTNWNREAEARLQELLISGVIPCVPTISNSIGMRLAFIPPGKFLMGKSPVEKEIDYAFFAGVYSVTEKEYWAVSGRAPRGTRKGNYPVESLMWVDAARFCEQLSRLENSGLVYRLPTEIEWEYACRAGTRTAYNTGHNEEALDKSAWHELNTSFLGGVKQVGVKAPNAFGLYDMHGNVWEWCQDWHHAKPEKIVRGGCWASAPEHCSSWHAACGSIETIAGYIGFRVVATHRK